MPSPKSTTPALAHTVRHTPDAYLVLNLDGATVERFTFDADDFHGSRRVAYREALAYAAELDEAMERAAIAAMIAEGGQVEPTFTAIPVADILDALCEAVDYARSVAPVGSGWYGAIDRAWGWLLEQDVLHFDAERHALRVESATSPGVTYTANGDCQCEAFTLGDGVCFHRAAARLVRRALERRAARPEPPPPVGARCIWRFGGTAAALRAVIAERQQLVAA